MKTKLLQTIITLLLMIFSLSLSSQQKADPIVDFSLTDTDGISVNLITELENGKTVMLYFFSTTCIHCEIEAEAVDSVFRQFGSGTGDLLVWGIAYTHANIQDINDFKDRAGITFPCFPTDETVDVHSYYNINYTPQIKLICNDEVSPTIPNNEILASLEYCTNTTNISENSSKIEIRQYGNQIEIYDSELEISSVQVYDLSGKMIKFAKTDNQNSIVINNIDGNMFYLVRISLKTGQTLLSKIVTGQ